MITEKTTDLATINHGLTNSSHWGKALAIRDLKRITLTESSDKEINEMILRFHVKMGITNLPSKEMLAMLIHDVRRSFGKWKVIQIEHAFHLGLEGLLDINMNLYNKPFNLVFLSQLTKAYEVFLKSAIAKRESETIEYNEPSEKEKAELNRKAIITSFEKYRDSKIILNPGNSIYESLSDKIQFDDSDFKEAAIAKYKQDLKDESQRTDFKRLIIQSIERVKRNDLDDSDNNRIQRIIYDLKLKKYFDSIIEKGKHIVDLIDGAGCK